MHFSALEFQLKFVIHLWISTINSSNILYFVNKMPIAWHSLNNVIHQTITFVGLTLFCESTTEHWTYSCLCWKLATFFVIACVDNSHFVRISNENKKNNDIEYWELEAESPICADNVQNIRKYNYNRHSILFIT